MDYASPSLLIKFPEPSPNSNQWFSGKQIQIHKFWGYPSKIDQNSPVELLHCRNQASRQKQKEQKDVPFVRWYRMVESLAPNCNGKYDVSMQAENCCCHTLEMTKLRGPSACYRRSSLLF